MWVYKICYLRIAFSVQLLSIYLLSICLISLYNISDFSIQKKYGSFPKETYNLIDPTNQSHPISYFLYTTYVIYTIPETYTHTCGYTTYVISLYNICHLRIAFSVQLLSTYLLSIHRISLYKISYFSIQNIVLLYKKYRISLYKISYFSMQNIVFLYTKCISYFSIQNIVFLYTKRYTLMCKTHIT